MRKYRVKRHAVTQPSDPSYRLIPLTQGQNAIVDAADYEWLSQWNWNAAWKPDTKSFYAAGHGTKMHRLILGCDGLEQGDHKDHNTLNNRRTNLRKCTNAQNSRNRRKKSTNKTGYVGVCWKKAERKWCSQIVVNWKAIHLGYFPSKENAARVYDEAAKKYFGEFAHLNFPT